MSQCVYCGTDLNKHRVPGMPASPRPEEGDYCMCMYCGAIQRYDANLQLRGLTMEEIQGILANKEYMRHLSELANARQIVAHLKARRN